MRLEIMHILAMLVQGRHIGRLGAGQTHPGILTVVAGLLPPFPRLLHGRVRLYSLFDLVHGAVVLAGGIDITLVGLLVGFVPFQGIPYQLVGLGGMLEAL